MDLSKAINLLLKHRDGSLTEEERAKLEQWYFDYAKTEQLTVDEQVLDTLLDDAWNNIVIHNDAKSPEVQSHNNRWIPYLGVAASLLLLCGLSYFWIRPTQTELAVQKQKPDIQAKISPGTEKAYLTLSNGQKFDLYGSSSGILTSNDNVSVVKVKDGELHFINQENTASAIENNIVEYNEITTPRAGHYVVRLPDNTKVWLNAASSLRFPTRFDARERVVEVKGEAFFEVSKSVSGGRKIPFFVKSGEQTIEVLGTKFNVNNYSDEKSIKTTLIEGSIKVNFAGKKNKEVFLQPGQQLEYVATPHAPAEFPNVQIHKIDTEAASAWRNGYFKFDHVGVQEMMRQIGRWYDMEIIYEGEIGYHEIVGEIERTATLDEMMTILEVADLSFKIEGKKILVSKKKI